MASRSLREARASSIRLAVILGLTATALTATFFACKARVMNEEGSSVFTTSDLLKEFQYEVRSTVRVPLSPELVRKVYDFDELGRLVDKVSADHLSAKLPDFINAGARRTRGFAELYGDAFPATEASAGFWVQQQLKYTLQALQAKNLNATLTGAPVVKEAGRDAAYVTYEYTATVRVAKSLDQAGEADDSAGMPIAEGTTLKVPSDPLAVYFEVMGQPFLGAMEEVARRLAQPDAATAENFQGAINLFDKTRTPDSLRTAGAPGVACLKAEGDIIYPFNLFYYLNPDAQGCAMPGAVTLTFVKGNATTPAETFPEYHLLFADKKVTSFLYFGVMSETSDGYQLPVAGDLKSQGYTVDSALLPTTDGALTTVEHPTLESLGDKKPVEIRMSRRVGGMTFEAVLAADAGLKLLAEDQAAELVRQRFRSSEIVIYDGHAGYGRASAVFSDPSVYPIRSYQIVFLNACWSYKYALSTVLGAKALRDFDFQDSFIDVLTTFKSAYGYRHDSTLLAKIAEAATAYEGRNTAAFKTKLTWFQVVKSINDLQGSAGGIYAVSGEEANRFRPDAPDYAAIEVPQLSEEDTFKALTTVKRPEVALVGARAILTRRLQGSPDLDGFMAQAKPVCERLRAQVANTEMFTEDCALRSFELGDVLRVPLASTPAVALQLRSGAYVDTGEGNPTLAGSLSQPTGAVETYEVVRGPFSFAAGSRVKFDRKLRLTQFVPVAPEGQAASVDLGVWLAPAARPATGLVFPIMPPQVVEGSGGGVPALAPFATSYATADVTLSHDPRAVTFATGGNVDVKAVGKLAWDAPTVTNVIEARYTRDGQGFSQFAGDLKAGTTLSADAGAGVALPELNNWVAPMGARLRLHNGTAIIDAAGVLAYSRSGEAKKADLSGLVLDAQGKVKMVLCRGGILSATEDTCLEGGMTSTRELP